MVAQIDLSGGGGAFLRALGMVPGPVGIASGLLGAGLRGNNIGYSNAARASWGQSPLNFGQTIGGLLGLNSYGIGGSSDRLGDFRGTPVAPGGMVSEGGFLGLGGTMRGAYTPAEAQRRYAASLYGNSFGTPPVGTVTPTPVQPQASVPSPGRPVYSKAAFDMGAYNADPDPIGAMVRGFGASANGGGRSGGGGGGGYGGYGGGGRSDRSTMSSGRG